LIYSEKEKKEGQKKEEEERPRLGPIQKTDRPPTTRAVSHRSKEYEEKRAKTPAPCLGIIPGRASVLDPKECGAISSVRRGGALVGIDVSEIHHFPLRARGFEEPLFPTSASKRLIVEHLLEASWLCRASELEGRTGEAAHVLEEPIELKGTCGWMEVARSRRGQRRCSWRRERVVKILERWREVRQWWDEDQATDRLVFRVLLASGAVVDLARERSGEWVLVGVVD
jgi:hypothetical protein